MKILYCIPSLDPREGGPANTVLARAGSVASQGHEVEVVSTTSGLEDDPGQPLGVTTERKGVPVTLYRVASPRAFKMSWDLLRALPKKTAECDIVHVHSLYLMPALAAPWFARKAGTPYIIQPHGGFDPYHRRHSRWKKWPFEIAIQNGLIRDANAILYTSQDEWDLSRPAVYGRPGAVVPVGVSAADYADATLQGLFRQRFPELAEAPYILFVGRLAKKKRPEVIVEAVGQLARDTDLPEALKPHCVLVGPDYGMLDAVRSASKAQGIDHRVHVTGQLNGRDKLAAFADATLFALPSHSENFGIVIAEALSASVPVLITEHVNIWQDIAGAEAGLIGPIDPTWLAQSIKSLLLNPERRAAMGVRAQALAREKYDWSVVGRQLHTFYSDVIGRADAAAPAP